MIKTEVCPQCKFSVMMHKLKGKRESGSFFIYIIVWFSSFMWTEKKIDTLHESDVQAHSLALCLGIFKFSKDKKGESKLWNTNQKFSISGPKEGARK